MTKVTSFISPIVGCRCLLKANIFLDTSLVQDSPNYSIMVLDMTLGLDPKALESNATR